MVIQAGVSSDKLRLDTATEIGATHTIMVDIDNPVEVVADLTSGAMADVVMDIATVASTVPMAIELARWNGGRVLLAGLKHFQPVPNLITDWIVMKSLRVFGGSGFTPASMAKAVEMLESGHVKSEQWPTSPLLADTERALLRFTEQYVVDAQGVTDADAAGVTTVLSGPEIAAFTIAIGTFDAICRFTLALADTATPKMVGR